ncbi:hypothetical protein PN466_18265 [Roseofilum reptotaenium CS-1145]|uniref:Uncharacterized protein n=1 Tax=Roseofilum reptotaenium AO1-A TaxID=1925591 RepID=A0A1L9QSQ1_9CYAN|nr:MULTISPECIES: hypothetical protein [Roseofilum]MBP0029469.1 hypothetical protein [Roseofilum sp. Guam]MDB9518891.1 hypothetical protein [Roseofilum reptotaenium CS-1145]OJJ25679.1 hypothetical protein BI308_10160 [Roseofilum reptotaenium AO1-A]
MSVSLPSIIQEQLVQPFKYWNNGVQDAMSYQNEMYTYVRSYSQENRLQAYSYACDMAEQNIKSCITCSEGGYKIWVNLKCVSNHQLETNQNLNFSPAFS